MLKCKHKISVAHNRYRLLPICALGTALLAPNLQADDFIYNLGKDLGTQNAQSAWENLRRREDCHGADKLGGVLTRSIRRIMDQAKQYGSSDMVDYMSGYVNGIRGVLADVSHQCTDKCVAIGRAAGAASAIAFCELAKELGNIPFFTYREDIPNVTCGEPYRTNCETTFLGDTQGSCGSIINRGSSSEFDAYYQSDQNGCCAYKKVW